MVVDGTHRPRHGGVDLIRAVRSCWAWCPWHRCVHTYTGLDQRQRKEAKKQKGSRRFICVEHATFEMLLQYRSPIPSRDG